MSKAIKKYGLIYKITNNINNKCYIGQTIRTLKQRFDSHVCSSNKSNPNTAIARAIKKYGKDNFKIEILEDNIPTKQLNKKEYYYMNLYNTYCPLGYNIQKMDNNGNLLYTKFDRKKFSSLRVCKSSGGSSKYCGVSKKGNLWFSGLKYNGTVYRLGCYKLETDAAKAYDIAVLKYVEKDDIILNFPELKEDYINNKIILKSNGQTIRENYTSQFKYVYYIKNKNKRKKRWVARYKKVIKYFLTEKEAYNYALEHFPK